MEIDMPKKRGIIHSTVLVTMVTFLIKFLGLVKQSVLAAVCGATAETDAFFVGSGVIVSLCIVIFSAISISLLSLHTDALLKEGREKSNDLINAVLRVFIPISLGITLIFFMFSTPIGKLLLHPMKESSFSYCHITSRLCRQRSSCGAII